MTGLQYKVKEQRNASTSCSETGSQNKKTCRSFFFFFFFPVFKVSNCILEAHSLPHMTCHTIKWLLSALATEGSSGRASPRSSDSPPSSPEKKPALVEEAINQNSINTTCSKTRKTLKRQCCHMLISKHIKVCECKQSVLHNYLRAQRSAGHILYF